MDIYYDIIMELFYDIHYDLGVSYGLILDYVNNLSPFVITIIGIHLGVNFLRQCCQ